MLLRFSVFLLMLLTLFFILSLSDVAAILNITVVTIVGIVAILFDWVIPEQNEEKNEFKFRTNQAPTSTNIILWDRCSIDVPNLAYLQKQKFEALYFCTTTGASPDLSLIKAASGIQKSNHWEYRTDNSTHLKLYLILALYHIYVHYGNDVALHIFTKDPDLKTRFTLHCNAYEFKNIHFITDEVLM